MGKRRARVRARNALAVMLSLGLLTGCSGVSLPDIDLPDFALSDIPMPDLADQFGLDPLAEWQPQAWAEETGVSIRVGQAVPADDPEDGAAAGSDGEAPEQEPPMELEDDAATQLPDVGLREGRIRNDTIGLAARYVELPRAHAFNERMNELIQLAITETRRTYTPQVHPASAKLSDRGCVPGSLSWPAARVLQDAATGPVNGKGTAMTCEVLGTFGSLVEVGVRIVSGSAPKGGDSSITSHRVYTLYADLSNGLLHEGIERWTEDAPVDLWERVVTQLRRDAGGLSASAVTAPDDDQRALAQAALDTARTLDTGEVVVTVREGFPAAELEGLSTDTVSGEFEVIVAADVAAAWVSDDLKALQKQRTLPFVGLPEWNASLPVNCTLVPCIAVTFDDGPSEFTPKLLDTLRAHQAAATFFVLGDSVENYSDTLVREALEGHEIGSHTMTHPRLTKLNGDKADGDSTQKDESKKDAQSQDKPSQDNTKQDAAGVERAKAEVLDAADLITGLTGVPVTSFRPPYGEINDEILKAVELPAILWSVDTEDWKEPGVKVLIERGVTPAKIGDIILFHDTHKTTVDAADQLLTALADRGFTMVTVSQMFQGELPDGKVRKR